MSCAVGAKRAMLAPALLYVANTLVGGCALEIPRSHDAAPSGSFACEQSSECPYPDNACLLATCLDGQCVQVAAPQGTLPDSDQRAGDCQQRYCDGHGTVATYPAPADLPPDDANRCTEARCDVGKPVQAPLPAGAACGEHGLCNGAGTCGVCLPGKRMCRGPGVASCSRAGQWTEAETCAAPKPLCAEARCIGPVQIAAGGAHACARFDNGSVRCWGAGQGPTTPPAAPPWGASAAAAQLGRRHACGLSGGTVRCWGANDFGQLGDGGYHSSAVGVAAGVTDAVAVAVAADHSCARRADGTVWCWGGNDQGQLGRGKPPVEPLEHPAATGAGPPEPRPTPIALDAPARGLLLGARASCTLDGSGPRCRGLRPYALPASIEDPPKDAKGPEADAAREAYRKLAAASDPTPAAVNGLDGAAELACGGASCCARRGDGAVWCWGDNRHGQLGRGPGAAAFKATVVAGISGAGQIALGDGFACALLAGGKVRCWGDNRHGQLGRGAGSASGKPGLVPLAAPARSIALGDDFACALLAGGALQCWGAGARGQLGRGSLGDGPAPAPVRW